MAGRPREFDRDEALKKAQEAFWTRGYEGTSMADLVSALGLASARIYAAFGSKEDLFREAVERYEAEEGSFVARALAEEPLALGAIERILRDAVDVYTRPGRPHGCMVVSAATSCAVENDPVREWLSQRRKIQTTAITDRLKRAVRDGELESGTDTQVLGDYVTSVMHGLSVQARDGVSKKRLHALCKLTLQTLSNAAVA
ncbi:Transcriptional regulator, TetR family [Labilithrix luteola]|uniref:Transcriptional regulator, TetR family n=1 Tax=Labilithrix luteola TaxID=1391654 RepID=A0A0K1PKC7_9BACT|nr:TetR/AcrR family transcriptional regulator [Labilithrix luteola]AKU93972.1 Transcriptional regulator, TetR family [Labilithrix luteola]